MDTSLPEILASGQLYTVIDSLQSTKYLAVACFALLVYDYFLTLEQEVKLFWRAKFTITRNLFFLNRYLPPINFLCYNAAVSTATFTVFELIIMQAILVARVVHLWTWKQSIQQGVFGFFLFCIVVVSVVFGFVMEDTDSIVLPGAQIADKLMAKQKARLIDLFSAPLRGCFDISTGPNARLYWAMLVPTFVKRICYTSRYGMIDTCFLSKPRPWKICLAVLVVLTVIRVAGPLQKSDYKNKLLKCLMRDGCIFYFCVCVSVGFGVVGSAMWNHPRVSFPAIFSGFLPVILSICASRLLFNLHELAEELVGEPTFALNNVELGRLNLRKGPRHGEFIVEVGHVEQYPLHRDSGWTEEERWSTQKTLSIKPVTVKSDRDWLPYIHRLSKFHVTVGSFMRESHQVRET
ncbi:hypothetical protein ACEPAH_1755 [Sanghuangporus vaninii]